MPNIYFRKISLSPPTKILWDVQRDDGEGGISDVAWATISISEDAQRSISVHAVLS